MNRIILTGALVCLIATPSLTARTATAFAESESSTDPTLATWKGGEASAAEVEERLGQVATKKGGADAAARLDALVARYHKAAQNVAVANLVLASVSDMDAALKAEDVAPAYAAARRRIILEAHLSDLRTAIEISDDEISEYYEAEQERFRTPKRVSLWNIYRRDGDGDRDATMEFLRGIRERYLEGETFGSLAREYSQSETRLRDGQVGSFTADKLPEKLAEVVMALEEGEVSEPHGVSDGAVLLHVSDVTDASRLSLEEATEHIRGQLVRKRLEEEITKRAASVETPEEATILSGEEFEAAVSGDDQKQVVLEIGTFHLTAIEAARMLGTIPAPADVKPGDASDEARSKRTRHGYKGIIHRALLFHLLESDPTAMDPDSRLDADQRLREVRDRLIVDEELRRLVRKQAGSDEERLSSFYDDNAHHFQSPLRFEIRTLSAPLGDDSMARMKALEGSREQLMAGKVALEAVAKEFDGEITDVGWKEFAELTELGGKVQRLVLELGTSGFTIPFQDEERLHLVQVVTREQPRTLSLEEAKERVLDEYLERHQRTLSKEIVETMLNEASFSWNEKALRTYLLPPAL